MYQYTTTTIINSSLDSNGTTAKYAGSSTAFSVTRVGKFLPSKVVSINKRPYAAGVKEVAQVTIPTITAGLVARLEIDVRLAQQTNSEYASTYLYFKKPIFVEVIATGTAATDATALAAAVNSLKTLYGYSYVTATTSSADVILTATDNNQRFENIIISKSATSYNSIIEPEYTDVSAGTFSVTTAGKLGFGDDNWMARSVMIQTPENTRYFGTNKEERPVIGGNYTQYTIRYSIDKDGTDGIVAGAKSITTHVFYVLSSLVSGFETALSNASLVPGMTLAATGGDTSLATATDDTNQIIVTNAVGAVTYSSDQPTRATVSATGLVSTAGVTGTGAVVITVTDAVGNTATISYTIT